MNLKMGAMGLWIVTFGLTVNAMAQQPPRGCQGPREERAYRDGVASGRNLVQAAWNNVRDCDRVEMFGNIVQQSVDLMTLPVGSTSYVVCRYLGTTDAMMTEMSSTWGRCNTQCRKEGEGIGRIAAKAYCDLSIALGGLGLAEYLTQPPVLSCGSAFITGCKSKFLGISMRYANPGGRCYPYTVAPFTPQLTQQLRNQCLYEGPVSYLGGITEPIASATDGSDEAFETTP